jgi:stalled ribosome alternative rescue factor ArfA
MKTIEVTLQEIWKATRPIVQKSKKSYTRKTKHKNKENNKL